MRLVYPKQIEGVSNETWRDYWQFLADKQEYQTSRITFENLREKWGHTYWFYDNYLELTYLDDIRSIPIN